MHFGGLRQKSLLQEMAEDHIMGAMFLSPAVIPKRSPNLVGNTLRKVEEGEEVEDAMFKVARQHLMCKIEEAFPHN